MTTPEQRPSAGQAGTEGTNGNGAVDVARLQDQQLVDLYREGETRAFEELYRRYRTTVMRRLTRMCGNEAVAEELTQEAFLRAANNLGGTGDMRFGAWVTRIGTNMGIDHIRSLRRTRLHSFEELPDWEPAAHADDVVDAEQHLERQENRRFLALVLDRLNPRHRQVLVLRELEGLDYASIAERMEISYSAVETLLFRARARFRQEYAKALAAA